MRNEWQVKHVLRILDDRDRSELANVNHFNNAYLALHTIAPNRIVGKP